MNSPPIDSTHLKRMPHNKLNGSHCPLRECTYMFVKKTQELNVQESQGILKTDSRTGVR